MKKDLKTFTAYITKYALTQGILVRTVEKDMYSGVDLVKDVSGGLYAFYHKEGGDYHLTMEAAIIKANQMKEVKLKSLEKQIKKLEKRIF